ncbi:hypothetical protein PR048_011646 [Dryococelus australis]|uniref:DUF4371 domain-containing protein n=1 Tax=Dryococelus australis TaxID=614101 RepID=A0ABQ9HM38_9NEOP|nr:hypothetical protein PR048_011646 [Dryococelus australis]
MVFGLLLSNNISHYVHCYAHQCNLIVAQSKSRNQHVSLFFSNLNDIINFFSHSPQRIAVLDDVGRRISHASSTSVRVQKTTIEIVYKIELSCKQSTTINQTGAIRHMLNDLLFVFWLTVFFYIMPHVDVLYNQLQKKVPVPIKSENMLTVFNVQLRKKKKKYAEGENSG